MHQSLKLLSIRQFNTSIISNSPINTTLLFKPPQHTSSRNFQRHIPSNPTRQHHHPRRLASVNNSQTRTTSTSTMSTNTNPATPPLVRFYDPSIQAADANGRTLSSILALPDSELEYCHDYIQLLFPLPETSAFHPSAPIIDAAIFHAFRSRPDLRTYIPH